MPRLSRILLPLVVLTVAAAPCAAQRNTQTQPADPKRPQPAVLSPRDTVRLETTAGKHVFIDYGRPSMRGRKIMGELVPFGRVWRTGANAATTFVTDVDLLIGTVTVPRGTYTLYTVPTPDGWTLIVNRQTGQWGTQYEPSRDLARIPMRTTRLERPVERFTIHLEPGRGGSHTLALEWEHTRASIVFRAAPAPRPAR